MSGYLEHVAGRGNRLQFLDVEARPLRGAPDVDDRIDAGHDDALFQAANREFGVDLRVESALKLKPLAHQCPETGELELDGVDPKRQPRKFVGPGVARHRRARFEQRRTGDRYRRPGQHAAGRIGDLAKHLTAVLRRGDAGERDQRHQPRNKQPQHVAPLNEIAQERREPLDAKSSNAASSLRETNRALALAVEGKLMGIEDAAWVIVVVRGI